MNQTLTHEVFQYLRQRSRNSEFGLPVRADKEYASVVESRSNVLEQKQGRFSGPVKVFQNKQKRLCLGGSLNEIEHAIEHIPTLLLGRKLCGWWYRGDFPAKLGRQFGHFGSRFAKHLEKRCRFDNPGRRLDDLHKGHVRVASLHFVTLADKAHKPSQESIRHYFFGQARLADTWFAAYHNQ
jgi:hypothetical protein